MFIELPKRGRASTRTGLLNHRQLVRSVSPSSIRGELNLSPLPDEIGQFTLIWGDELVRNRRWARQTVVGR